MSDKKHIDRIFQEKLKDFEATPNPEVWKNIQSKLEQPKQDKEKVFPIWLRIASIAAILFVLLTIGNSLNSNFNTPTETIIVDTKKDVNNNPEEENLKNSNTNNSIAKENNNLTNDPEITVENLNTSKENSNKSNTSIANSNTSDITINNNNTVSNKNNKKPNIVTTKNNSSTYANIERTTKNNSASKSQNNNTLTSKTNIETSVKNNIENSNTNAVAETNINKVDSKLKNSANNTIAEKSTNSKIEEKTTTDVETKKEDTSIEEAIAKAEDLIEKEEEKVNRWQLYANVAPVYYNTLGKGSSIDDQFIDNSKSGETNMSYGVNVSYAFNDKLKLRTGVNSLNLSYDTDDVIIYENVSGGTSHTLKNIDFDNQAISAISATNLGIQQSLGILPNENAAISQRLGYYEIPLELEYTISNKKIGVNIIAGMSTMLLNENKISSEFEGRKTEIGEANNINDVSFTGNLGLGLDYKFSKKIKVNMQPTFKYQMNAFENTSGDFKPYIIGVYTGLSYKF